MTSEFVRRNDLIPWNSRKDLLRLIYSDFSSIVILKKSGTYSSIDIANFVKELPLDIEAIRERIHDSGRERTISDAWADRFLDNPGAVILGRDLVRETWKVIEDYLIPNYKDNRDKQMNILKQKLPPSLEIYSSAHFSPTPYILIPTELKQQTEGVLVPYPGLTSFKNKFKADFGASLDNLLSWEINTLDQKKKMSSVLEARQLALVLALINSDNYTASLDKLIQCNILPSSTPRGSIDAELTRIRNKFKKHDLKVTIVRSGYDRVVFVENTN